MTDEELDLIMAKAKLGKWEEGLPLMRKAVRHRDPQLLKWLEDALEVGFWHLSGQVQMLNAVRGLSHRLEGAIEEDDNPQGVLQWIEEELARLEEEYLG
jgi:hypothetical protein